MKKRICAIAAVAMLVAATAFAAGSDQAASGNSWEQMYQYCNQAMQSWGSQAPGQNGTVQPQDRPMSYNGGMMTGGGMGYGQGHMMNGGGAGHMGTGGYSGMMGGSHGNMMGIVQFQ